MDDDSKNIQKTPIQENDVKKRKFSSPVRLWYRFEILTPEMAILRGSRSINDPHFKQRSRGHQASAASVIAIVFGRLFDPKEWSKIFIDQVLEYGDKLFRTSVTRNRVSPGSYLSTNLIYPEFYIDDYKILISIGGSNVYGNLFTSSIGCPDFTDGLQRFFKLNDSGVLTAQGTSVAIWRIPTGFLYFDPSPCTQQGLRTKEGVACLLKFSGLTQLGDFFLGNLDRRYDSRYCIDKVTVLRVTLINRGILVENSDQLVVDKNVLRSLNPMDVEDHKVDCTRPAPNQSNPSKATKASIRREPLTITISNYKIDERLATVPLADFKSLDTGYPYYDMEVNVPSTFKDLSSKISILHGWTHESSEMYKGKGAQNVANCVAAIGMKKVHPVKTWLRPRLDEVLVLGDALYADVKSAKPTIKTMTGADLDDTKIKIEEKKMFIDVDLLTVVGTLSSKISSVLSLRQALEEFFLVNTNGIVECSSMAVAVWTQDDYFYMFDPRQCDATGLRIVDAKGKSGKGKKDSGDAEKKVKGKCCVTRFTDLDSLVGLFLRNVDPGKKDDRFIIRSITVVEDVPGTRAWKDFEPGEPGKTWILRGGISNDDENFEPESRGLQGIAMSIVGLINARNIQPTEWTKETVDVTTRDGDAYYNFCIPPEEEDEENRKLVIGNLKKNLYVNNRKVKIDVEPSSIVGNLKAIDGSETPNLAKGISQFFENRQYGIVEVKDLSIAIWKFEEELKDKTKEISYYCYDANPRGKFGQKGVDGEEEVACVIRAVDSAELARVIEANVDPEIAGDDFSIHEVKVVSISDPMTPEEIEQDKAIPIKPDMNFYTELGENGACLNGSFDQSNEIMFKHSTRGKQQAANALVALAMRKLYNPHLWYREVVDDVLKVGDQVTQKNLENLPEEEDEGGVRPRDYLLPVEIAEEFEIGVNRVTVAIDEEAKTGKVSDLGKSLEEFFQENTMGIFRQDDVMLPVWKEGNVFFTMDSRGRDNRGIPKEKDGAATVLWFTGIDSLAESIGLAVGKADGDFVVDSVTMENVYESRVAEGERLKKTTSGEDLWHHFPKKDEGIWELPGTLSLSDEKFPKENHLKQTSSIAIIAIIFSKAYEPRQWSKEVLDEVIITGDKLHSQCVARLGTTSAPRITEIVKEFFLSNRRIDLTVRDCVQAGDLSGKPPKVQDLKTGLEKFFNHYTSGVLTIADDINLATWKFGNFYYCLIPGIESKEDSTSGLSRLTRFANLEVFADYLKGFLGDTGDYIITSIDVVDWNTQAPWKYDPSPAVRPSNLPPINAYRKLPGISGVARAILHGGTHQGAEIFPQKIRNRQTAANCILALAMSVIRNPATWTKIILDDILVMGSIVHFETMKAHPTKERFKPKDVVRVFHVGVNVLTADVEESTISGPVAIPPPEPEVKGKGKGKAKKAPKPKKAKKGKQKRVPPPPPPPIYLEEGLKNFFDNNPAGVLVTGRYMTAVWKAQGVFFMYDPQSCGDQGLRLSDNNGTCCVMWFACIEPLYDLIFANIDDDEKYGHYDICRVIIRTTLIEPLPCPAGFRPILDCTPSIPVSPVKRTTTLDVQVLTEYRIIDEDLSVLRGTRHMNAHYFDVKSRGLQSTAIAAVAIVVGMLHVPSTWTSELIDAVLKYGDTLHTDSARAIRPGARTLSPKELLTVFIIGDVRASIEINCHLAAGILHVFDLTEALRYFFRNNCSGILHTANIAVAVMQHYGQFYMFDPCSRNESGRTSFNGAACVMRCQNIQRLAQMFVTNCNYKVPPVYTINAVNVNGIHFFSDTRSECPAICEKRSN